MGEYFDRESLNAQRGFHRIASVKPFHPIAGGMRFYCEEGFLDVSFYAPGVIRFQVHATESFDYGLLVSQPQTIQCDIKSTANSVVLSSAGVELEVILSTFTFRLKKDGRLLLESTNDRSMEGPTRFHAFARGESDAWQVALALKSGEPVYGLGEKFGRLNHRGGLLTSWNYDALSTNCERSYKNNPFAWSPEGWGFFVHTPGRVKHAVGYGVWSHRSYIAQVEDANLDFFLFAADTPAEILDAYTNLTGKSPQLPLWSYGVWMARAFYRTADDLLNAVKAMRAKDIPLDVILLDGRAWHKPETRFDFSWDPDRYPDPAGFMARLKEYNVRLCLWEYTYISTFNPLFNELANRGFLLKTADERPYIHQWMPDPLDTALPQLCPSGIIDLTNPQAYEWFRDQHKPLFELGVAVMKTDFGEAIPENVIAFNGDSGKRLHNVYSLIYNRCVYEAAQLYGRGEALVWGRSGWTGSQRYPLGWGGDPQSDWEGMAACIRGGQSWGMSGVPFYAHDIGGFYGTLTDAELFVRWTQAGVFTSHTRFHGIGEREPWIFGPEVEKMISHWMRFRYRLIPYLRSCESDARLTGLPVMRAMALAFPQDKAAWAFEEQYMFGPALLVAPITQPGGNVDIYLPNGEWVHLWDGEHYSGGQVISLKSYPLEQIPVFGRAGSWLPLGPVVQHTGELEGKELVNELWAFGDPNPQSGILPEGMDLQETNGKMTWIISAAIQIKQF